MTKKISIFFILVISFSLVSAGLYSSNINTGDYLTIKQFTSNVTNFIDLDDTPNSYFDKGGLCLVVNSFETGIAFEPCDDTLWSLSGNNIIPFTSGRNLNISNGDITADFFIGDGSQLTNLPILNSLSWNRSITDVFLANIGDNVGIGTTNPGTKLDVVGDIQSTGYQTGGKSGVFGYLVEPGEIIISETDIYQSLLLNLTLNPIEDFELTSSTKIKYIGNKTQHFEVLFHASLYGDTNGIAVHIADKKNGAIIIGSEMGTFLKFTGEEQAISGLFVFDLETNDEIEFVVRSDGADTLTFAHFTASIREFFD